MTFPLPRPRRPLEGPLAPPRPGGRAHREELRRWYVAELGWGEVFLDARDGAPAALRTGVRFDVLQLPVEAGLMLLRELRPGGPVALGGGAVRFLVAAGGAEEVPGLLDWLDWGALVPELTAVGAGGRVEAPVPWSGGRPGGAGSQDPGRDGPQGAASWLRPPEQGAGSESGLPGPVAVRGGGAPSLVRLVDAAASCCLRVRLRRAVQPLAFS
ncbi:MULTISPECIES: SCO3374 family protein [Streptomyces]|uniref:Proline-rich protein n=1 Tax=Streptomyces albus (strain ATCC 21838 / DSM 41398 / FERM P-419 / JCM 4703 / NBRC 107858) TaxID=1081613 RepID=A0A0B5EX44_STRA4|nr:SCO3374 family protein [Streptomyces sp. SCSIO ZS0520]AJE83251.1 proline-rich protein [Streptomyces albus]AOU77565.1 proline-rich protein [Streptomyces albus]AYN33333.1 hypothetical protein DUI70_2832 [Streptomyces albus]